MALIHGAWMTDERIDASAFFCDVDQVYLFSTERSMPESALAAHDWIDEVCRRFSEASGWPLSFEPAEPPSVADSTLPGDDRCWAAELGDAQHRIGRLVLDLPDDAASDRSFLVAQSLAELFAELIGRLVASRSRLDSRTAQFSTLVDVARGLPKQNLQSALTQLLGATIKLTGFRSAGFFLLDPTVRILKLRAQFQADPWQIPFVERRMEQSPPDLQALDEGRLVWRSQGRCEKARWLPLGASTGVCVAVGSDDGPLGTLWAFDRRDRSPSQRELHILESIAGQIASILERAVLMQESAVQHRMSRDLAVASESQPADLIRGLSSDSRLDIAGVCTSRFELGGDLCEVAALNDTQTMIAVGDASGDSVPAAMVLSAVRGALHSLTLSENADVTRTDWVTQQLSTVLHDMTPAHQFMSMLYGVVDVDTMTFTYTNAGHPLPLLIRDGEVETLTSHGMLLGVVESSQYSQSVVELRAGDLLMFFSDGVSEAMSRKRQMFRSDGIVEALPEDLSGTAEELLQSIWSKLEAHLCGGEADDRTLMVVKVCD